MGAKRWQGNCLVVKDTSYQTKVLDSTHIPSTDILEKIGAKRIGSPLENTLLYE